MVDQALVEPKISTSRQFVKELADRKAPLLAAYWELDSEEGRWVFYVVPKSKSDERKLVEEVSTILIKEPYRSMFSLSDVVVDGSKIERAKALGAYVRPQDIERHFQTTFTGGQYFEGFIVMYIAPELARKHHAA
jgi:hypothetical protein